jgi:hypothetical protein
VLLVEELSGGPESSSGPGGGTATVTSHEFNEAINGPRAASPSGKLSLPDIGSLKAIFWNISGSPSELSMGINTITS